MSYLIVALIQLAVCGAVVGFQQLSPTFKFPEAILLLAIVVLALSWGAGPGLLATGISAACVALVVFLPGSTLALRAEEDLAGVGLLVLMGVVICQMVAQVDRQRLRAEVASARMEEFLKLVSHELRTPLTSLQLTIQVAARRRKMAEHGATPAASLLMDERTQTDAFLASAERQIGRLSRLVSELVDAARIETDKLQVHLSPADMTALLQEVADDQRQALQPHPLQLRLPRESVHALVDADRIGQVVSNYLSNAGKYSPPEEPVTLLLRVRDQRALVAVRDRGPGLTPEQQARIWQRGERLAGVTVQSGEGANLGLGLYLCRAIIEGHGGQVGVRSRPGHGAVFWFTLPLPAAEVVGAASNGHGPSSGLNR
jgi:signal transduction histidine kinase